MDDPGGSKQKNTKIINNKFLEHVNKSNPTYIGLFFMLLITSALIITNI